MEPRVGSNQEGTGNAIVGADEFHRSGRPLRSASAVADPRSWASIAARSASGRGSAIARAETSRSPSRASSASMSETVSRRAPIRAALASAGENFVAGVSMLIVVLITILPWAALAFGGWWLISLLRTRFAWLLPPRTAEL